MPAKAKIKPTYDPVTGHGTYDPDELAAWLYDHPGRTPEQYILVSQLTADLGGRDLKRSEPAPRDVVEFVVWQSLNDMIDDGEGDLTRVGPGEYVKGPTDRPSVSPPPFDSTRVA